MSNEFIKDYRKIPKNDLMRALLKIYPDTNIDFKMPKKDIMQLLAEHKVDPQNIPIVKKFQKAQFISKLVGKPTMTDEQIFEKIENLPIIDKNVEFGETGKKLLSYQKKFVQAFNYSNSDGAVMIYGVGTGKTLTGLAVALRYLQLYTNNKVVFITPKAILNNWISDIRNIGIDPNYHKFIFTTYDQLQKKTIPDDILKNALTIFDEAHILRTNINKSIETGIIYDMNGNPVQGLRETVSSGTKVNKLMNLNVQSHKTLLLTGTPFVNTIQDIANLLLLSNQQPSMSLDIERAVKNNGGDINMDNLHNLFDYKVDIYFLQKYIQVGGKKELNPLFSQYPTVETIYQPIVLNAKEMSKYKEFVVDKLQENDAKQDAFDYFSRLSSNTMGDVSNKKLEFVLNLIKTPLVVGNKKYVRRVVIYSTFVNTMIKTLKKVLTKENILFSEVTGSRKDSTQDYIDGKTNVFIISKAGTEGLNLLRTDALVIYEPLFNESAIVQAVARGVRFKSHVGHHSNKITVYRLITISYNDVEKFDLLVKQINGFKIEDGEDKKIDEKQMDNFFNQFVSNSKTKHKPYISFDTVDPKLLLSSFYKQLSLIGFFKTLEDNVLQVKEYHNKLLSHVENYVRDHNQEVDKRLPIKEINKIMNRFILEKVPNIIPKSKKIEVEENDDDISKTKILQQYFTPDDFADFFISDLVDDWSNNEIDILEPTAGQGSLINAMMRKNKSHPSTLIKYTAVEFDIENVGELHKIYKETPMVDITQGDFMRFENGKQYDYIMMNPPFRLKVKMGGKKLLYDYDFVERAYDHFLKNGGTLKAIVAYNRHHQLPEHIKKYIMHEENIDFSKDKKYGKWKSNVHLKGLKITIITIQKRG